MKELLLAKSNIRKGKGLAIGLVLLMILAACFLNIVLVIFLDLQQAPYKQAEKLNSEDAIILLYKEDRNKVDEQYFRDKYKDDFNDIEMSETIAIQTEFKYSSGSITTLAFILNNDMATNCKIGKTEIVEEDSTITSNYVYLPLQFHTGGKIEIGEDYKIKIKDNEYTFKVRGFLNNVLSGCYNAGSVNIIVDDKSYDKLIDENEDTINTIVKFDLKDDVNSSKFINNVAYDVTKDYKNIGTDVSTLEIAIFARTFTGVIIGVSFLIVSTIIITIVLLMLSNSISNYIKENIRILGAIKAVGFTSKDIKRSFLLQFLIITIIGLILGIVLSYVMLPTINDLLKNQSGLPVAVTFNPTCTIITAISIIVTIILTVTFFIRKIKKIEPISALRNGVSTHNFKRNRIKLEKTALPLNMALAVKTMFTNIKQNIVTFIITFFLIFSAIVALVMYQNFSVKPDLSILTFEICNGAVQTAGDKDKEIFDYIESLDGVKNTRLVTSATLYIDDARIMTYILGNPDRMRNDKVCYDGKLPEYDNEVALSGKFCKAYNIKIGDEVEMYVGEKKSKYIVTGLIQTTNNMGQEGVLLLDGAKKIVEDNISEQYYFDVEEGTDVNKTLDKIKDKFGDRILGTANFDEIIDASMGTFVTIANAMVVVIMSINAVVILLVLYLLMKTLISNKKKDYGILKAIGYTSKNIVFQNAVSYMPSIIFATLFSSIASVFIVNPYLSLIMNLFGIMRLNLCVPFNLVIYAGIGFAVVSFIFAILLSLKIRKIEPYNLLTED